MIDFSLVVNLRAQEALLPQTDRKTRYVRSKSCRQRNSGVTSHRQPLQCRGAQGPKTVKGAQGDPNYVSRLLLDCVPVFHKIITPAYLLYSSGPVACANVVIM